MHMCFEYILPSAWQLFLTVSSSSCVYCKSNCHTLELVVHVDGCVILTVNAMNLEDLYVRKCTNDSDNIEHRKHRISSQSHRQKRKKSWTCDTMTFVVWSRLWEINKPTNCLYIEQKETKQNKTENIAK